jgi:hypothetical protein
MGLLPSIAIAGYWQHHTASGRSHPPEALIAGSRRIAGAQISGDTVANCTSGPIYGELRSCRLRTLDSRQGGRQQWLTGNDNVEDGQPHGRADNNRDAGAAIRKERRLSRAQCGRQQRQRRSGPHRKAGNPALEHVPAAMHVDV